MAVVKVLYWKEIPVQVQAEDATGRVSRQLDGRFQEAVDAVAMIDGSAGTDAYLEAWDWGETSEAEGTPEESAMALAVRFNSGFPDDLVQRIQGLEREGLRDPRPGAIDHWADHEA